MKKLRLREVKWLGQTPTSRNSRAWVWCQDCLDQSWCLLYEAYCLLQLLSHRLTVPRLSLSLDKRARRQTCGHCLVWQHQEAWPRGQVVGTPLSWELWLEKGLLRATNQSLPPHPLQQALSSSRPHLQCHRHSGELLFAQTPAGTVVIN